MKLVSFRLNGQNRLGAMNQNDSGVYDLNEADPTLPSDMTGFISLGTAGLERARAAVMETKPSPLANIELLAPIPSPRRNIFCVGKNYRDHLDEVRSLPDGGGDEPDFPIVFTKATTAVAGPDAQIVASSDPTNSTDYEGELAVVIGQDGHGISRENAMAHVYGYTIINDVTSRVLQSRHHQWFLGKSLDGYCPMGPALLTADAVPDVQALHVVTRVNGVQRQNGRVGDLIFDIPRLIEEISSTMTLLPGDIISTGTPAGVGAGRKPPEYLRPGDRVEVTIEPIGTLSNVIC